MTRGVAGTRAAGAALAAVLRAGDLVVLTGPLGAGKTAYAQGVGSGLGVRGRVTSPTFVLARVHPGDPPMVHVDAYRLAGSTDPLGELDALDLDAELADAVTVVEWGAGLVEHLAPAYLEVRLDRSDSAADDTRTITVIPHGPGWAARLVGVSALTTPRSH